MPHKKEIADKRRNRQRQKCLESTGRRIPQQWCLSCLESNLCIKLKENLLSFILMRRRLPIRSRRLQTYQQVLLLWHS